MDEENLEQIPFPEGDLMELLAGFYAEAPRLVKEIAPQGWECSPYPMMYARALAGRYSWYRHRRLLDYLSFRLRHPNRRYDHVSLVPLAIFQKSYFPPNSEPLVETLALLVLILIKLTDLSSIVHRTNNEPCSVSYEQADEVLEAFAKREGLVDQETDMDGGLLDQLQESDTHDYYPFYEAVFRVLKSLRHRWRYLDADLYSIACMQDEYRELSLGISSPYSADTPETMAESITEILLSYKAGHVNPLDFERIFKEINRRKTPDEVLAYLHVYGDFPQGYPMKMTDYIF